VASALVLLAAGAMTATAGNRHVNSAGQPAATKAGAITTLTTGAMLEVKAQNDEETSQEAALDAAKAQAAAAAAQAQAQAQAQVAQAQANEQDVNDEQDNDNNDEGEGSD
jgi:hypothetical protein